MHACDCRRSCYFFLMKSHAGIFLVALLMIIQFQPVTRAQELDGSDINKELLQRAQKVNKLSIDEQLKLRAAEQKAAQDPEVKAALEKRNKAILELRAAIRASILKSDPTMESILDKIATGSSPGF